MLKYRPSKFEDRLPVDEAEIIETVILAVPGGIQDQNTASWTGESMDPMQKELARTAFEAIGEGPQEGITKAINRVKENFKNRLASLLIGLIPCLKNLIIFTTCCCSDSLLGARRKLKVNCRRDGPLNSSSMFGFIT